MVEIPKTNIRGFTGQLYVTPITSPSRHATGLGYTFTRLFVPAHGGIILLDIFVPLVYNMAIEV